MRRRTFLAAAVSVFGDVAPDRSPETQVPWYRRTLRWGQTNITEKDPACYDIGWWRQYWRRTQVQGVIINAGGVIAYYPSRFPLHQRSRFLGERDLFGELAQAAHEDGLVVLARMDSSRASEAFYHAHPDWFAVDAVGQPYRLSGFYITCVNSPYYSEYIPDLLREIIGRAKPEGITDNSWSGLGRDSICYCDNCAKKFRAVASAVLPRKADWDDPLYRKWIEWSYQCRLEIWERNNRVTKSAGGPDCLWVGMNSGSIATQSRSFRDYREICKRAEIILLDYQTRSEANGFQHNAETGKLIHMLLGWEKLIPESMAMYQAGRNSFRLASKPEPEARMWMLEGFAGGIQPWWHHVGAYHEDRRMYQTAEPIMRWHKVNEKYLIDRRPMASVGVVWSQRNVDFYGRNNHEFVELPWRGMTQALIRARIPYLPIHADDIDRYAAGLSVLVLPNLAAVSDQQCKAIRRFVQRGGSLIATGSSTLYDEWGDPRKDFGLADVFGAHTVKSTSEYFATVERKWAASWFHSYLRLSPELRAQIDGPRDGTEPPPFGKRHSILRGFEQTDIIPFGGMLVELQIDPGALVPLTFVPPFPVYPPEDAWMRVPKTTVPGLILRETGKSRIAFMPADLDRRFAMENLPDHGNLLANIVRWAAADTVPLAVKGPGLIDCHLYSQPGQLVLHLVNLTNAGTWRAPIDELIPMGPFSVGVRLPSGLVPKRLRLLVSGEEGNISVRGAWANFAVRLIVDHEVAVIE